MLLLATIMGHHDILIANVPAAAISSLVYLVVGNRIFIRTSNQSFGVAFTIFTAIYGVAVLLKL